MRPVSPTSVMDAMTLDAARRVIAREVEGLEALASWLGVPFVQAVNLMEARRGRIIVSGMGKSGHVARKIAATLSSTGTAAFFVHPAEASHGDLGMITPDDVLLLLSNSGETSELRDIIAYSARFAIPLIGMVRRAGSVLVDAATVALVLPETPEATHVAAPTTSTAMMMALGDALAVALLERRGFSPEDFQVFHPGGRLGQAFTRVAQLMHTGEEIPLTAPSTPMRETLLLMTSKRFGCAGVSDPESGRLAGVITDGDLRRHIEGDMLNAVAGDVMTPDPVTIRPQALAQEALAVMQARRITSLFVADDADGKPKGILHIHDLLRAGLGG